MTKGGLQRAKSLRSHAEDMPSHQPPAQRPSTATHPHRTLNDTAQMPTDAQQRRVEQQVRMLSYPDMRHCCWCNATFTPTQGSKRLRGACLLPEPLTDPDPQKPYR